LGIIFKQSLKGTAYSYAGTLLGFVITGLMLPNFFSTSEVGLFRVLVSYGTLFAQLGTLGLNTVTVKLFPHFRDAQLKHSGFLGFILMIGLAGALLSTAVYLSVMPFLIENAQEKSELFVTYVYYVLPLLVFTLLFNLLDTYYSVLYNAVKGIFYREVIQRVLILLTILLFYFGLIDFRETVMLYVGANVMPALILLFTIIRNRIFFVIPSLKLFNGKFLREFFSVSVFGFINSFSGILALNIDIIMITALVGLSATGVYTIAFFFGTLILIPSRPLVKISSVIAADAWKRNDLKQIRSIYGKSSLNLTLIGLLMLAGIWGNIDNVFHLITSDYLAGKYVILIIGFANILDLLNGTGKQIIFNSRYYKVFSVYILVYVACLIALNYVLIPVHGIIGAAFATLASKMLFNLIITLHMTFRHQAFIFNYRYLLLAGIALLAWYASTFLPALSHFILDIFVRSAIISVIYLVPVIGFRISPDLNDNLLAFFRRRGIMK
jgi:O-antigen/teichoic acid export membrane protein